MIWRMIGQRLLLGLLTLFVISVVIFGATELLPGDLARELLGQSATPETLAALREQLGLERARAAVATGTGSRARSRAISASRSPTAARSRT
jgi:ABC-type dipeptide/oligopeptide/nickel transport system permease component